MLNLRNNSTRRISVSVNANVSSGSLAYINGILGIPLEHKLSGNTVTFLQEGIVALTYSGHGTVGAGSFLYWDVSASLLSVGAAAADMEVGQVIGADPDGGASRYLVRMNIGFPRAAAGNGQASIAA